MTNQEKENKEVIERLLAITSAREITSLIKNDPFFSEANCKWVPYGKTESNAGRVEGQMRDSSNAFVEKITNSIDALLMRRCYEVDKITPDSRDAKLPQSLSEALHRYFDKEEISEKRSEWAKKHLCVLAEGNKSKPTLTIVDRGEGQSPDKLQETIVNLSGIIKRGIPFVFGKYHQGGSASIRFCGEKRDCYQLVLSRRAETIATEKTKNKKNDWGFTLVRRNYKDRTAYYEYCTKADDETFSFSFDEPIKLDGLEMDFVDGTLVRLYDYYLSKASNITYGRNSLALDIDQKLQKSPLPIFLSEQRNFHGDTKYTVAGLLRRIENNKNIVNNDVRLPVGLGGIGKKEIRCIRLKHISDTRGVDSYRSQNEKVFYIENGLALGRETESFLSRQCELPYLAPYLLCYVDMSDIPVELANIFHAGREEFARTDDYKSLKDRLKLFFENEIFGEWEKEYREKDLKHSNDSNKELDKLIEKAIIADPDLQEQLGIGERIAAKDREEGESPYEGQKYPTKFELIGKQPREIDKDSYAIISFRTDAADDLLTRDQERYHTDWSDDSQLFDVVPQGIRKGIVSFRVDCRDDVEVNDETVMTFSLLDTAKNPKFNCSVKLTVGETLSTANSEFPTFFTPRGKALQIPANATRKLIFTTDVTNDYFNRDKDAGIVEFKDRDDLEMKGYKLKDGILTFRFYATLEEIGKIPDINIIISNKNGSKELKFNLTIPAEIVSQSSRLDFPEPNLIEKEDWPNLNWGEDDIASVVSSRTELIVNINADSKPLKELKKMVGSRKRDLARNQYITNCYLYSLYLYFELKDKEEDALLELAMKAIGKALPGIIRKSV